MSTKNELLLLACDEKQLARSRAKAHGKKPKPKTYDATFFVLGADSNFSVELVGLCSRFPLIQMLPEGELLVCAARARDGEENAEVFDREGKLLRRFRLGDAVADVRCTSKGVLWVSYFDEGYAQGPDFVSALDGSRHGGGGLKTFDSSGRFLRHFEQAGIDCYAMNVSEENAWCLAYPGFALTKFVKQRAVASVQSPAAGSSAFVVAGGMRWEPSAHKNANTYASSSFAFYGGYGSKKKKTQILKCRFMGRELVAEGSAFNIDGKAPQAVMGVGSILHVVQDGRWLQFELEGA